MTRIRRLLFIVIGAILTVAGGFPLFLDTWFVETHSLVLAVLGSASVVTGIVLLGMAIAPWGDEP